TAPCRSRRPSAPRSARAPTASRPAARRRPSGRASRCSASRRPCSAPILSREPLRARGNLLLGGPQLLRRVDRQPEAGVPERVQPPLCGELRKRRRLVVALLREARDRLVAQHVVAAVDPERDAAALAEPVDHVVVAELDDAELRVRLRDRDRRERIRRAMPLEHGNEVDVDELVAVQRVDVPGLLPEPGCVLDPAAPAEPLGLLRGGNLGAEPLQLALEDGALPGGAGHDHPRHAGPHEPGDLVGRERPARDVDERLRAPAGRVAEPLGLAAGEDDRLQGPYASAVARWAGVSGSTSVAEVGRPMPSYANPAARVCSGSRRLRPSMIRGFAIAARTSCDARPRSSSHSVTITAASAPRTASATVSAIST